MDDLAQGQLSVSDLVLEGGHFSMFVKRPFSAPSEAPPEERGKPFHIPPPGEADGGVHGRNRSHNGLSLLPTVPTGCEASKSPFLHPFFAAGSAWPAAPLGGPRFKRNLLREGQETWIQGRRRRIRNLLGRWMPVCPSWES